MDCSEARRRSLSQGLAASPLSEAAAAFVRGTEPAARVAPEPPESQPVAEAERSPATPAPGGRISVTLRLPAALAEGLWRVSLERRLRQERPFAQQDIVAEAVREWLERKGGRNRPGSAGMM
jgi:hypothetical protein